MGDPHKIDEPLDALEYYRRLQKAEGRVAELEDIANHASERASRATRAYYTGRMQLVEAKNRKLLEALRDAMEHVPPEQAFRIKHVLEGIDD